MDIEMNQYEELVYDQNVSASNYEIFKMRADGSDNKRLTFTADGFNDMSSSWSKDGDRIVCIRSTGVESHVWIMNSDGEGQGQLTSGAVFDSSPTFSTDGNHISLTRSGSGVCVMNSDGSNFSVIMPGANLTAWTWIPDTWSVVYSNAAGDVYSINHDGTNNQLIFPAVDDIKNPVWSPDGSRIAFLRENGSTYLDLWVMDSSGANQNKLTDVPSYPPDNCQTPSWSPDGQTIVLTSEGNGIYLINPDGSNLRSIISGSFGSACFKGKPR